MRPTDASDVDALAAEIQGAVDALVERGVDKIVLLAHMQQFSIERALATRLADVDIIVAGGSNTLLADADDTLRPGDTAVDGYPLVLEGSDEAPVLLVNVDGDYGYLGRLVVGFDAAGQVLPATLDEATNGAWATTAENVAALGAQPDPEVVALATTLREVLAERDGNIVGRASVYLDGRRGSVRSEETNMGNLTADANLWLARQADPETVISLKNGGGIRAPIGLEVQPPGTLDPEAVEFLPPQANPAVGKREGDISQFDLQGTLRFNNGLTLLTLSAAELRDVLEHALAEAAPDATPGAFPQVAGLAFSFDPTRTAREGGDTNGAADVPGMRVRTWPCSTRAAPSPTCWSRTAPFRATPRARSASSSSTSSRAASVRRARRPNAATATRSRDLPHPIGSITPTSASTRGSATSPSPAASRTRSPSTSPRASPRRPTPRPRRPPPEDRRIRNLAAR